MSAPTILALESATSCVGCAVGSADGILASTYSTRPRRHAESLAPQMGFVLEQAGVALADLDAVAVDVGPGLYTGLRIGITTGRALAHTLSIPVIAVSSLDAIAESTDIDEPTLVAIDARRGEVFHSVFTPGAEGRLSASEPGVTAPDRLTPVAGPGTRVVGDGALAYADALTDAGFEVDAAASPFPLPDAVLRWAIDHIDDAVAGNMIEPLYLRRPDAVAHWEGGS